MCHTSGIIGVLSLEQSIGQDKMSQRTNYKGRMIYLSSHALIFAQLTFNIYRRGNHFRKDASVLGTGGNICLFEPGVSKMQSFLV